MCKVYTVDLTCDAFHKCLAVLPLALVQLFTKFWRCASIVGSTSKRQRFRFQFVQLFTMCNLLRLVQLFTMCNLHKFVTLFTIVQSVHYCDAFHKFVQIVQLCNLHSIVKIFTIAACEDFHKPACAFFHNGGRGRVRCTLARAGDTRARNQVVQNPPGNLGFIKSSDFPVKPGKS